MRRNVLPEPGIALGLRWLLNYHVDSEVTAMRLGCGRKSSGERSWRRNPPASKCTYFLPPRNRLEAP
jgi:hypothetical protein